MPRFLTAEIPFFVLLWRFACSDIASSTFVTATYLAYLLRSTVNPGCRSWMQVLDAGTGSVLPPDIFVHLLYWTILAEACMDVDSC